MTPYERKAHKKYLEVLRAMTAEQHLRKAFELSDFTRQLFVHGLRQRYPDVSEEEFQRILRQRLDKCHNRNY